MVDGNAAGRSGSFLVRAQLHCGPLRRAAGGAGARCWISAAAGRNVVGAGTGVLASERSARSMCLAMASVRRSSYCAMQAFRRQSDK